MIAPAALEAGGWMALAGGMGVSFLCSGMETGTYAVNKIRLDLRAESGSRRARRLRAIQRDPTGLLIVLLIGNNLANYVASAGLVLVLMARGWAHSQAWAVAILTPLIFIFCELWPKNLFHRHGETLTYVFSWFLRVLRWVFVALGLVGLIRGLVWAVMKLLHRRLGPRENPLGAAQRIAGILHEGRAGGALTHAQSIIAERVVNIGRVRLRDAMIPLERAVLVPDTVTGEQVRQVLAEHGHPRLGVYSGERTNVVGVLNAYDVLLDDSGAPPAEHVAPPVRLPGEWGIIQALVELQRRREAIACVLGPEGQCVGIATVKDLVEEIVGELEEW